MSPTREESPTSLVSRFTRPSRAFGVGPHPWQHFFRSAGIRTRIVGIHRKPSGHFLDQDGLSLDAFGANIDKGFLLFLDDCHHLVVGRGPGLLSDIAVSIEARGKIARTRRVMWLTVAP
jgi:hypothetical protein